MVNNKRSSFMEESIEMLVTLECWLKGGNMK